MSVEYDESVLLSANYDYAAEQYRSLSPSINFGQGNVQFLERLVEIDKSFPDTSPAIKPETALTAGWLALEVSIGIKGSYMSANYAEKSQSYMNVAKTALESDNPFERLSAHRAIASEIKAHSLTAPLETTTEDVPGMYAESIDGLLHDGLLRKYDHRLYSGLITEFVTGAVLSKQNIVTVPASVRHDQPRGTWGINRSYDLEAYPTASPIASQKAFKIQVKLNDSVKKRYASDILLIDYPKDYRVDIERAARGINHLYSGTTVRYGEGVAINKVTKFIAQSLR